MLIRNRDDIIEALYRLIEVDDDVCDKYNYDLRLAMMRHKVIELRKELEELSLMENSVIITKK